jgi:N-hydroxyarylamine O-acetyltransferase
LLSAALREIGFDVTDLAARVLWNVPEGAILPRTHMLLRVDVAGEAYIADVGFGGLTLTTPLRLTVDIEQATSHEPFRLVAAGDGFLLQASLQGAWRALYQFDLQPQFAVDFEMSSWYLCHHPESIFLSILMAARPFPGGRYGLLNHRLTTHFAGGESKQRVLASAGELRAVLEGEFGVRVPDSSDWDGVFTRLIAGS